MYQINKDDLNFMIECLNFKAVHNPNVGTEERTVLKEKADYYSDLMRIGQTENFTLSKSGLNNELVIAFHNVLVGKRVCIDLYTFKYSMEESGINTGHWSIRGIFKKKDLMERIHEHLIYEADNHLNNVALSDNECVTYGLGNLLREHYKITLI